MELDMSMMKCSMIVVALVSACAHPISESQDSQESTGGFCMDLIGTKACHPSGDQLMCQEFCQEEGYGDGYCPEYTQSELSYCETHCNDARCGNGACYPSFAKHCAAGLPP